MRKIAVAIMIFVAAMAIVGCTNNSPSEQVTKKEIVVACGRDDTGTLAGIMQEFTAKSETTQVKLLDFPNESVELHRVISSMLSGQEIQLDAMLIEDVWVGEFIKNNHLLSMGKFEDFDSEIYPEGITAFVGDGEKMYWYPVILDMGLMYYRDDLTGGGLTLTDLTDGADNTYTLQGADGEEMLCCALEFINLTGSVKDGLMLYKRALDNSVKITDNYLADFKDGKANYARSWASDSRGIFNSYLPSVKAEVLRSNDKEVYSITRAYGFAVNHATQNPENCLELLEYLKSDEVQKKILKGMGTVPLKRKYYEDPMIVDSSSYIVSAGNNFDSFNFRPARDDYTYASREARAALNAYLADENALDAAVKAIINLTGKP